MTPSTPAQIRLQMMALDARWQGRRIGLYGGSFNPGHEGHRHVALEALKRVRLDAIWLMVSPGNPLKDGSDMAPFDARLESARDLADCHPRLFVTDVEARLGSRYTAQTLDLITGSMPRTRFLWMMGADNMQQFGQWFRWRDIARKLPIAIFDRPAYSVAGFAGQFARAFARYQVKPHRLAQGAGSSVPQWSFIRMPRHPASATNIRHRLGHQGLW